MFLAWRQGAIFLEFLPDLGLSGALTQVLSVGHICIKPKMEQGILSAEGK